MSRILVEIGRTNEVAAGNVVHGGKGTPVETEIRVGRAGLELDTTRGQEIVWDSHRAPWVRFPDETLTT